jgi:hypothetical protein
MSIRILGPSIDNVVEPAPAPPPTPNRIAFLLDNPPTLPGGLVNLVVPDPFGDKSLMPQVMYAVYIPKGQETALVAGGDPEAFLASSFAKGSANLNLNGTTDKYQIAVPGVAPGTYYVQVIYEYTA